MALTNGIMAIIDEMVEHTNLTRNEALNFLIREEKFTYINARNKLLKDGFIDSINPYYNTAFWNNLGFTVDYVVNQVDLNS